MNKAAICDHIPVSNVLENDLLFNFPNISEFSPHFDSMIYPIRPGRGWGGGGRGAGPTINEPCVLCIPRCSCSVKISFYPKS